MEDLQRLCQDGGADRGDLKLREKGSLDKRACYKYEKRLLLLAEELREGYALSVDYLAIERVYDSLTIHDKHEVVVNGGMLIKEYGFNQTFH